MNEAQRMGIKMHNPQNFVNIAGSRKPVHDIQTNLERMKDYNLIIVILSDKSNYYCTVKQIAEMQIGCLTQCLLSKSIQKLSSSTITNLLLKINTKLNGTNHCLVSRPNFLKGTIMVMGADVTHPSPQNKDKMPSFAAVTASYDQSLFKYNVICQLQLARREVIVDLKSIVMRHLVFFHKQMNRLPDHIVFFRDGVSEGQFDVVRETEVNAIKFACSSVPEKTHPNYNPKLTCTVVMKRHHTRFFPTSAADTCDKNHNVKAGTCVDNGITHPTTMELKDFYLASHSAVQGVTKPTKYCTIYDDADLSYDDLEEITYYLCHTYSKCTRSVSYPPPTYYAHLAAERAKKLYDNVKVDFDLLRKNEKIPFSTKLAKTMPMSFI